jgi:CubicO group peptidase (beta-lactamase class C family)
LTAAAPRVDTNDVPAAMARVESGLLPPVLVTGEKAWTLAERMAHHRVPGLSLAVIDGFEVVWEKGYGVTEVSTTTPVTAATLFQAASISKPVTAAAVLRLVEQGKLSLDEDVNTRLRSWKLPENEHTREEKVTLAHLMSHSGGTTVHGFPGYAPGDPLPTLVDVLEGRTPANTAPIRVDKAPGGAFRYSGGGTTIVQQLIQDTTGVAFPQLMRETVLGPAGMSHSTFEQPLGADRLASATAGHRADGRPVAGKRHVYPEMAAAGLWTTAGDLARFAAAIQRSAAGRPGALLSRDSARRMMTKVTDVTAIGFFIDASGRDGYFEHGGGNEGFVCLLLAHEERGQGAVVMTNSETSGALIFEILRAVAREYSWPGFLPDAQTPATLPASRLEGLAGRYRMNEDMVLDVAPRGGRLLARVALAPPFELIPVSADTFVRTDWDVRYRFSGDGERARVEVSGEQQLTGERAPAGFQTPSERLATGDVDGAVDAYRAIHRARPDAPAVAQPRLNELGLDLLRRGQRTEALTLLKLDVELHPRSALAADALAEALLEQGAREDALASYERVLALAPEDDEAKPYRNWLVYTTKKKIEQIRGVR